MSLEMEAESSEVGEEEGKPSGGNQVLIIDDDITKLSKKGLLELCLLQNWQWSFFLNGWNSFYFFPDLSKKWVWVWEENLSEFYKQILKLIFDFVLLLTIIFLGCDVCGEEVMMMNMNKTNSKRNQEMLCWKKIS